MRGEKYEKGGVHALFTPFRSRSTILFRRGWMEELDGSSQEKKRSLAKRGWERRGRLAADIAKELHVTRKFVYTMSAPPAPSNVYWWPPRSILAQWRGFSETLFLKHEGNTFLRTDATMYTIGWCCYVVRRKELFGRREWKEILFLFSPFVRFGGNCVSFFFFTIYSFYRANKNRNNFSCWRVVSVQILSWSNW